MGRKICNEEFMNILLYDRPTNPDCLAGLDLSEVSESTWRRVGLKGINLSVAEGLPKAIAVKDLDKRILEKAEQHEFDMCNFTDNNYIFPEEAIGYMTCKTTHCRAGWAFTLSENGTDLYRRYGPEAAGALIYAATYPNEPVPDFYCSNEEAIADMKKHA